MAAHLAKRLAVVEARQGGSVGDRPSLVEIWYWKLEDAVGRNLGRLAQTQGEYDHFALYAHVACLESEDDVARASDDVLLEALGLADVEHLGWLQFMVRDLPWFNLLAANWGWPALRGEYGGGLALEVAEEAERRAQAGRYFVALMRERGLQPLATLRAAAEIVKVEHKLDEARFVALLRTRDEWGYFLYTCETVQIRPEAIGAAGPVQYPEPHRATYAARIRAAAEHRRQNWNAPRTCACVVVPRQ